MTDGDDLRSLAAGLAGVGRAVRAAVGAGPAGAADHDVVRSAGGDEVFGVDARAEAALLDALADVGARWPGRAVVEGVDGDVPVGDASGPWRYIVDPVDGSRPWLAGKRSAWVLLGAGRDARTLEDLEVGAAVELPTARAALGLVAWATTDGFLHAEDHHLVTGAPPVSVSLQPRATADVHRAFVTVARFAPGSKAAIGAWEDARLRGLETYEDPYLCSGGQLMEIAAGREAAVFDPRPLLTEGLAAHPYDLAALVVARAAGVIVEALPPGPLRVPLDTTTPVAWAAYANEAVAARLRPPP
jgi:fructose-1,6-bisphosphatase/inositol monophosphatase family enzyme